MRIKSATKWRRVEIYLLVVQGIALTMAAITFALLPPDKGPILLVSLRANSASRLVGANLRLVGAGRLPGSLVVAGERPSFMEALVDDAVLILPAVPLLCGSANGLES